MGKRKTCSHEHRYILVGRRHRENGTRPPTPDEENREASRQRMTGAGCPKWNNGMSQTQSGYILVKPPPDYPFATKPDARGYFREHRMVMELHLGRQLLATEVVHHINGVKNDNRLENLELIGDQVSHMAEHYAEGLGHRRWPKCVLGCGRQAKPYRGHRYHGCAPCRRLAVNQGGPAWNAD
jgi:hypothetical protein